MLVYPSSNTEFSPLDIPDYRNDDYYNVNYSRVEIGAKGRGSHGGEGVLPGLQKVCEL